MADPAKQVIVVGAGIVGASIAYHLARRGAPVTVIDSADVAGGRFPVSSVGGGGGRAVGGERLSWPALLSFGSISMP